MKVYYIYANPNPNPNRGTRDSSAAPEQPAGGYPNKAEANAQCDLLNLSKIAEHPGYGVEEREE